MNMGKDLTEVRSPQRQLAPDIVGLEQGEPTFLWGIANKAKTKKRHRFRDLYRCLNEELIYHAWVSLNKGAASGVDNVTAEAYAEDLHANIADDGDRSVAMVNSPNPLERLRRRRAEPRPPDCPAVIQPRGRGPSADARTRPTSATLCRHPRRRPVHGFPGTGL